MATALIVSFVWLPLISWFSVNKTIQNRSNINFQCSAVAQLSAPGGSVFSTLNQCVEMREGNTFYRLKICNDRDLCNAECNNVQVPIVNFLLLVVSLLYSQICTFVLTDQ
jgi:hypothetical protein